MGGSQKKRLSKDSIKPFNTCTICLKLCVDPLVCPQGDLFCKECIYQSLLAQKIKLKKQMNEFHAQQSTNKHKEQYDERKESVDKFLQTVTDKKNEQNKESVYGDESLSCFWIPSLTPNAAVKSLKQPRKNTYCPGCNQSLKRKQLIPCKFTLCVQDKQNQNKANNNLFECGSCAKILTNATKSACLSKCGHIVCLSCIQKFVSKNKCCVVCDEPVKKKHVIILSCGGTGFAAHGNKIEATKKSAVFQ